MSREDRIALVFKRVIGIPNPDVLVSRTSGEVLAVMRPGDAFDLVFVSVKSGYTLKFSIFQVPKGGCSVKTTGG